MSQYHLRAKDTSVMPQPAPASAPQNPPPDLLPASPGGGINKVTDTAAPVVNDVEQPTANG